MVVATDAVARATRAPWRMRATLAAAAWLTAAQVATGGAVFAVSAIRARHLPLEEFGAYALAAAIVAFLTNLADGGLSAMMVRDLARGVPDVRRYLGAALALTTALATVAAALVVAAGAIMGGSSVAAICAVLGVTMILAGAGMAPFAYLRAAHRTAFEMGARVPSAAALIALSGVAAATGGGAAAYAWATVASAGIGTAIAVSVVFVAVGPLRPRVAMPEWRTLARDSAPLGAAMMLTAVYYYADALLLGVFGTREDLARYSAAYVFVLAVAAVVAALRVGFMPELSRAYARQGTLAPVLRSYLRVSLLLALPTAIVGVAASRTLLAVVFGETYAPAANALSLLFVTAGVMCISSYVGTCALTSGRQHAYLRGTAVGAALNVGLNIALIPRFGIAGAAFATLIAETAVCVTIGWAIRRDPHPSMLRLLGLTAMAGRIRGRGPHA